MKALLAGLLATLLGEVACFGGTITGSVTAEAPAASERGSTTQKYQSRKYKFLEQVDYSKLRDFVVFVEQAQPDSPSVSTQKVQVIVQKDGAFRPHVLPVLKGTTVEWPNEDSIFHNVFSFSETKAFDLGLYKDEVKKVTFDRPGRVDIFCSIHKDMHCIVLVLENPYFAVCAPDGSYKLENLPPGSYRLRAWHERLPSQVKEVTVPRAGEVRIDFKLGLKNLPKY